MTFASSAVPNAFSLVTAMLAEGTFAPANLAGTWCIFGTSTGTAEVTMIGTVVLDASGNVLSGSYIRSDGGSSTLTGGALTIDSGGLLTGSITGSRDTITLVTGKMHVSTGILAFVGNSTSTEVDFLYCIKGT
jgi:hypothetical protein